jgi:hypothetical protein
MPYDPPVTSLLATSAPSWTETGGFWVALAAAILSLAAVLVSVWSAVSGSRSAAYAKTAGQAAEQSAKAADVSARAAEQSAEADGKVARVELERDHESYRPHGVTFQVKNTAGAGGNGVFATFVPTRSFRASGLLVTKLKQGESSSTLSFGPAIEAGRPVEFYICSLNEYTVGKADVHLRFWPPAAVDPGERWTCACDRPTDPESGTAHWELRAPLDLGPHYNSLKPAP